MDYTLDIGAVTRNMGPLWEGLAITLQLTLAANAIGITAGFGLALLVLSRFAGAAREMPEALIVNPYHVEETADALNRAATMPAAEQRERMASLRSTVREFNVFRWAGRMLADAGRWRLRARIEARVRSHQLP